MERLKLTKKKRLRTTPYRLRMRKYYRYGIPYYKAAKELRYYLTKRYVVFHLGVKVKIKKKIFWGYSKGFWKISKKYVDEAREYAYRMALYAHAKWEGIKYDEELSQDQLNKYQEKYPILEEVLLAWKEIKKK